MLELLIILLYVSGAIMSATAMSLSCDIDNVEINPFKYCVSIVLWPLLPIGFLIWSFWKAVFDA